MREDLDDQFAPFNAQVVLDGIANCLDLRASVLLSVHVFERAVHLDARAMYSVIGPL